MEIQYLIDNIEKENIITGDLKFDIDLEIAGINLYKYIGYYNE